MQQQSMEVNAVWLKFDGEWKTWIERVTMQISYYKSQHVGSDHTATKLVGQISCRLNRPLFSWGLFSRLHISAGRCSKQRLRAIAHGQHVAGCLRQLLRAGCARLGERPQHQAASSLCLDCCCQSLGFGDGNHRTAPGLRMMEYRIQPSGSEWRASLGSIAAGRW